jgi:hypothetical protein
MGFSNIQLQAWGHLTELEKSVLSLIIVNERSRQEAAAILNLAPYKVNEIFLRARKFFITFSEYYEKYDTLIPDIPLSDMERFFLESLILRRKKPSIVINKEALLTPLTRLSVRDHLWDTVLNSLPNAGTQGEDFLELLRDFDKWNAFRILPKKYHEVSPFSRRRIKEFKKVYKNLLEITDTGWQLLETAYKAKVPPYVYAPSLELRGYGTLALKSGPTRLSYYTRNTIPVFDKEKDAKTLAELVFDYSNLSRIAPKVSQKFWANFRVTLTKAINFKDLLGIKEGNVMELTERDKEFIIKASQNYKEKIARVRRTRGEKFWS